MHLFSQIFEWNREVNFHQQQMTRANASCKAKTKQNCSTGHLYDAHDSIWMLFHAQNNNMHNTHLHNVQCSIFRSIDFILGGDTGATIGRSVWHSITATAPVTFFSLFNEKKAHFPNHLNVEHARILQRTEPYLKSHEFRLSSSSSHCGRKQDEEYH